MSGNQTETETEAVDNSETTKEETESGPNWSRVNWAVIIAFTVLTLVGIAFSVGSLKPVVAIPKTNANGDPNLVAVPLFVYLYSGFGALGYIFTKLMVQLDQYDEWDELEHLVAMAMRIPAAWILAAGIYLFLGDLGSASGTAGARFAAGVAFLVGLYVNVALKTLGSLADRILGRPPRQS